MSDHKNKQSEKKEAQKTEESKKDMAQKPPETTDAQPKTSGKKTTEKKASDKPKDKPKDKPAFTSQLAASKGTSDNQHTFTPYQKAALEWDNRIGSAKAQVKSWRLAAILSIVFALVVISAYIYQRSVPQVIPYIVEIDPNAKVLRYRDVPTKYTPTQDQVQHFLVQWLDKVRSKSIDPVIINRNWRNAYKFVIGDARNQLSEYARANPPFTDAGKVTASIDVISVLKRSKKTYQITWIEERFRQGVVIDKSRYVGQFTLKLLQPEEEVDWRVNPLGLFITSYNWTKEYRPNA
jgi:type IV secretory pathway TrbF-like protein